MRKFVDCDREQAFLLPPDLWDWLPADDLGHFVIEAVERVDLGAFKVNHRGTGSAQYHPRMMLALLIYCYANGIFSSRRIERATHRDIGVRFVAANRHPDHDTIARFRRENFAAVSESFLQVLLLAKELKANPIFRRQKPAKTLFIPVLRKIHTQMEEPGRSRHAPRRFWRASASRRWESSSRSRPSSNDATPIPPASRLGRSMNGHS